MKKVIERIVESPGAPNENDLWLNGKTLKKFQNGEWVAISGGNSGGGGDSASSLSDMTDVDISSPSDGDTLVYNATTHKWESGSGGGCSCLAPMLVPGTRTTEDDDMFIPDPGAPTFEEARAQMLAGGIVYLIFNFDGVPSLSDLAAFASPDVIFSSSGLTWSKYQTFVINGTFDNNTNSFTPNEGEMSWSEAKQAFDNGDDIYLNSDLLTLRVAEYDSSTEALIAIHEGEEITVSYSWFNLAQ